MNGEPLPVEHGFPVRMVVPGLYGYVSATKWVVDLELTTFDDFDAYWVRARLGAEGSDQDGVAHRRAERRCAHASRRARSRSRVSRGHNTAASKRRGARRRRTVGARRARRRADHRHVAPVEIRVGCNRGQPSHRSPCDRQNRGGPARSTSRPYSRRRNGVALHHGSGRLRRAAVVTRKRLFPRRPHARRECHRSVRPLQPRASALRGDHRRPCGRHRRLPRCR